MKVSKEYILNTYKSGQFDREVATTLLKGHGMSDVEIEAELDLVQEDVFRVMKMIDEIIEEEVKKEISFIKSSMVDENDVRMMLVKFAKKLLK